MDVDAKNKLGKTPLQVALKEGCSELAQLLSEFRSSSAQRSVTSLLATAKLLQ